MKVKPDFPFYVLRPIICYSIRNSSHEICVVKKHNIIGDRVISVFFLQAYTVNDKWYDKFNSSENGTEVEEMFEVLYEDELEAKEGNIVVTCRYLHVVLNVD